MSTKLEVVHMDPGSTAKVVSLTIGVLLITFILIQFAAVALGLLPSTTMPSNVAPGVHFLVVIAMVPVIYLIIAYASVFIFCLAFNYACRLFGGIRIEFADN